MAVENAFTIGLAYAHKAEAPTPHQEQKNSRWKESRYKWSIITLSATVREQVMKELACVHGDSYGQTTRYFADRDIEMIDVPYEIMKMVFDGTCEDFIVMNKISEGQQWSISKNYTKGDLSVYFGTRFQGTYKTTGKKKPPQKVT